MTWSKAERARAGVIMKFSSSVITGGRDRCTEDRPASEARAEPKQRCGSRAIAHESSPQETEAARVPVDASGQAIPLCRFGCGQPASLPGPEGLPEHFSCRRKHEA